MIYLEKQIKFLVFQTLLEIRTNFKWKKFLALKTLEEKISYAESHLKKLGEGTSRIVFLLSNRYVLKIAQPHMPEVGKGQNETEVRVFTHPKTKKFVTSIYKYADDFSWLVSELVRPLKDEKEMEELTGIGNERFILNILQRVEKEGSLNATVQYYKNDLKETQKNLENFSPKPDWSPEKNKDVREAMEWIIKEWKFYLDLLSNNSFLRDIIDLMLQTNLLPMDLAKYEHWGKTIDGKIVLLDYGYDAEVAKLYPEWY